MKQIKSVRLNHLSAPFIFIALVFLFSKINAQNITYTSLYNSSNFIKTIDLAKPVGTINAGPGVSSAGAVSYTLPIYTPPGTNGLEPSVALAYNSQSGNGVAGVGWGIGGLSVISRTGKNIYHNGTAGPVTYTSSDAFLLDGMRLNAISGANGANGTIYALESENFSKIISTTTGTPDNPSWFQVTAKDGTVMEYGKTVDSKIQADNNPANVIYWRLNKTIDVNGNYIEFKYDNTSRDSRLSQILYTGNSSTGLSPYNQINFTYKLRTDVNSFYEAGASLNNNYLLEKIAVVHSNDAGVSSTIMTYKLGYGFDNVSSFLKEITQYGGLETDQSLNSTIFLYGDQPQNFQTFTTSALAGSYDFYSGDFNADGKTDMIAAARYLDNTLNTVMHSSYSLFSDINSSSLTLMYEKPLPQGTSINNLSDAKFFNFLSGDYNGDGRDDVLQVNSSTTEHKPCGAMQYRRSISGITINYTKNFNDQTGYTEYQAQNYTYPSSSGSSYQYVSSKGNFFIPGDFDGNGNQDYITVLARKRIISSTCPPKTGYGSVYVFEYKAFLTSPSTNEINVEISNFGFGTNPYPTEFYAGTVAEADKINTIDINGDGRVEIIVTKDLQTYILSVQAAAPSTGFSYTTSVLLNTNLITKDSKYFPGDFNSDKKTDMLVRNSNGTWNILYSTGLNFTSVAFSFSQPVAYSNNQITDKIIVSDFNGDGKSDVFHGYNVLVNSVPTSSKLSLYYSRGAGTTSFYYEQYSNAGILGADLIVGDFNGDGRSDFLNRMNIYSNGAEFISIKPFGKERMLAKVTDGHNVTTSFDYKLLTDKTTYPFFYNRTVSLDDAANLNSFNYVELPMYAVQSFTVPDGVGGNNTTSYKYEDGLLHRTGRGFLGFKK